MNDHDKAILQAVYDKACQALIQQGCQSYDFNEDICLYRGPNGTKCAVGHLITDEMWAQGLVKERDTPLHFSPEVVRELLPGIEHVWEGREFLRELQSAHDYCVAVRGESFIEDFKERARHMALTLGLRPIDT